MRLMTSAILSLAILANAASASALPGLQNEKDINNGLLILAVADKIRRACDGIGGRLFTAKAYSNGLKDLAAKRGYSDAEIDAYINDKQEKAKMRERRNAYFASKGASNLDAQSLCVLGWDEMSRKSQIGQLLRAK